MPKMDDIVDDYLPSLEEIARAPPRALQDEDEEWDGFSSSDDEPAAHALIPTFPEGSTLARTIEDLQEMVNNHGKVYGYAVVRRSGSNYKDNKPRWLLCCDKSGDPTSRATLRKTTTKKCGCPFEVIAKLNRSAGY